MQKVDKLDKKVGQRRQGQPGEECSVLGEDEAVCLCHRDLPEHWGSFISHSTPGGDRNVGGGRRVSHLSPCLDL